MTATLGSFHLLDDFEATCHRLKATANVAAEQEAILEAALERLAEASVDEFDHLAVHHADKPYRIVNNVNMLDDVSLLAFRTIGAAFEAVSTERNVRVAFLVDNLAPADRLRGVVAVFSALGFVVASPEHVALQLGEHDGLPGSGSALARYRDEATSVARRIFIEAVPERRNVLWLSGEVTLDELQSLASVLTPGYVGVFRNDAPIDGSTVQLFRRSVDTTSAPLG